MLNIINLNNIIALDNKVDRKNIILGKMVKNLGKLGIRYPGSFAIAINDTIIETWYWLNTSLQGGEQT